MRPRLVAAGLRPFCGALRRCAAGLRRGTAGDRVTGLLYILATSQTQASLLLQPPFHQHGSEPWTRAPTAPEQRDGCRRAPTTPTGVGGYSAWAEGWLHGAARGAAEAAAAAAVAAAAQGHYTPQTDTLYFAVSVARAGF